MSAFYIGYQQTFWIINMGSCLTWFIDPNLFYSPRLIHRLAGRAVPTPVRANTDQVDTLPLVDILAVEPPTSPPTPLPSPGLTAQEQRDKFRGNCKPEPASEAGREAEVGHGCEPGQSRDEKDRLVTYYICRQQRTGLYMFFFEPNSIEHVFICFYDFLWHESRLMYWTLQESGNALGEETGQVLTRNDQLSFKSHTKETRKRKNKTGKDGKGRSKAKTTRKGKENKTTKRAKGIQESYNRKGRQVLKKRLSRFCVKDHSSVEPTEAQDMEPPKKRPRASPAPASSSKAKGPSKRQACKAPKEPKEPQPEEPQPKEPKPKRGAKPKKSNAAPAVASAKPTAKPKRQPKAKAKSSSTRRPRQQQVEIDDGHAVGDPVLAKSMMDFALQFDQKASHTSAAFKDTIKGQLTGLERHSLNLYWTTCRCGLKIHDEGKDGHHVSFNNFWSPQPWKMAIAAKVAHMIVPYLKCIYICFVGGLWKRYMTYNIQNFRDETAWRSTL